MDMWPAATVSVALGLALKSHRESTSINTAACMLFSTSFEESLCTDLYPTAHPHAKKIHWFNLQISIQHL